MKTEAGLAVSYLGRSGPEHIYVGVPAGAVTRVHLPDDAAKARFVTALLKVKCEPGDELELFGEPLNSLAPAARARLRQRVGALSPIVGLITNLNVWENVSLPAAYHGAPPLQRVATVAQEVLGRFGIDSFDSYLEGSLRREQRQDLAVSFARPVSPRLAGLGGSAPVVPARGLNSTHCLR